MRVVANESWWQIERGKSTRQYFALWVDGKPSWTVRVWNADRFGEKSQAEECLARIRAASGSLSDQEGKKREK